MKKRFQVTNFYVESLQGELNLIEGVDGTVNITAPNIEDNMDYYIIIDPINSTSDRQIIRCYNLGGVVHYYGWSFSGNHLFSKKTTVQINDVAQLLNTAYDQIDDFGYVRKTGALKIKVGGGRVISSSSIDDIIEDTELTLIPSTTNYVYFDNITKEFKINQTEPESNWISAKVIVGVSSITTIEDLRGNYIGVGTELQQLTQAQIDSITDLKQGIVVFNTTAGLPQYYSGGTWFDWSTGTPIPRASEETEGKVRFQTNDEYVAGTDSDVEGAQLVSRPSKVKQSFTTLQEYVDNEIVTLDTELTNDINSVNSFKITSDYPLGEAITDITKSCVFKETAPTFAQATTAQNIGDVVGNTRVSFPAIGTGVAGNSLKLSLAKNGTPLAFLRVRIETDDGTGKPNGELVDPNATKDIDPATLTTSLVDTTVTFPGSFTVANGTKVHTVVSAVGDVVNASNYYKIGYNTVDTTTRNRMLYNGSIRSTTTTTTTDSDGQTFTLTSTSSVALGYRIYSKKISNLISVTKSSTSTATRVILKSDAGTTLATATFSGNTATLSTPYKLDPATYYRVECDNNGSSYTYHYKTSGTYPVTGVNIDYNTGSNAGSNDSNAFNIDSISTAEIMGFPYISSTLFHNIVLSLTDSDFAYKTSLYGISTALASVGTYPKLTVFGASDNFTGMTEGGTQYLGPTPGGIQSTAGTNSFVVGKARSATKLRVKDLIS